MPARCPLRRRLLATATGCVLVAATALVTAALGTAPAASAASNTTAWQSGAFSVNTAGVVSESDIFLGQPNTADSQSLPLGNGSLGVAAWAADGFTAQLNRSDTMPDRLSPGQVQIPGLEAMTSASNFTGTLDLYNGVLDESGGGMTMQAWVPAGKDELIVNVTGASPSAQETADLYLWSGRTPTAAASGAIGSLAQTWVDNSQTGNSGDTFGAMSAITAGGQNVTASVVNSTEVQVSFTPNSNGSFRVVVAAPEWTGGNATSTASSLIGSDTTTATSSLLATQSTWWNSYWANTGLIQASSSDGSAQYIENLRTIYLYAEAASMHSGDYPGSQAGVADMFAYDEDQQDWYPAGYWLWNLRGQIATNLSSGNFSLNLPIFSMYLSDLPAIESWTSAQMGGLAGACVPETMRFNGNGYYNGGNNTQNASCATASSPSYNAEDITSGAELAMWIWQQYQDTGSLSFLQTYYPILEQTAEFLLAYQKLGSDGYLHAVANAHETQWAVQDPTTDLAVDQALFPAVVSAATLLNTDSSLVSQLKTAEGEIEPYPRASESALTQLLNSQPTSASAVASLDAQGNDVIADSYQPSASLENFENIGLEPVWPWGVIGDSTTVNGDNLTALADRTYSSRPNVNIADWSYDAVDAARLDMSSQVQSDLVANVEKYQGYISGLSSSGGDTPGDEPYIEQSSDDATSMDEALATDYDGTLRIAPAWPSGWNASGTVYIQGGSKVDVQVEGGVITTAAIQAGTTQTMTVRNPWAGQQAEVVNGSTGAVVVSPTTSTTFSVPVTAGSSYLIEQPSSLTTSLPFAQVTGTQATAAKHLGDVQIGLGAAAVYPSLAASFNNIGITADNNTGPGNYDGNDSSFSETALTNAGAAPGATVTSQGLSYTFPNVAAGTSDNTVTEDQTITVSGSGTLGFLVSASYGPVSGSGTITYTDGSTQSYTLTSPDWWSTTPPAGGTLAISSAYQNRPGNTTYATSGNIFSETFALTAGKTIASVTLPPGGALTSGTPALHVFAIATSGSGGGEGPYGGTAAAVPGTVQAANYDTGGQGVAYNVTSVNGTANSYRSDGVDLETCTDTSCGYDLGWTATGQWFKYTVNVATAGTYTVSFRMASPSGVTDALHIDNSAGTNLSGSVNAPDTGGWQDWATVTASVTLPAGRQTLTVDQDNGGWNIHYLAFAAAGGTGSALTASPSSLAFGSTLTGSASPAQTVAVSNPNSSAVSVSQLAVSGPFGQTSTCGASIPANGSCTVSITFDPTAAGSASGSLTVASSAAGSPLTVALSGTGAASTTNLALSKPVTASSDYQTYVPSNVTDGNTSTYWESTDGASYPQTITVNLGSVQTIGSITLDLPPSSSWSTRTETLSVLGSTNGSSFSQIVGSAGYTFNPSTGNTVTISLPSGTSTQYVELSFTANTGWSAAQLSEFEIFP
jgi:carbohydrate binding protein with CBM6 domain/F5/8 type C domain-containing protein/centrosomal CEP192-like protein/glycosyl hydrolase family 95